MGSGMMNEEVGAQNVNCSEKKTVREHFNV
jgi:hypothetical protein